MTRPTAAVLMALPDDKFAEWVRSSGLRTVSDLAEPTPPEQPEWHGHIDPTVKPHDPDSGLMPQSSVWFHEHPFEEGHPLTEQPEQPDPGETIPDEESDPVPEPAPDPEEE